MKTGNRPTLSHSAFSEVPIPNRSRYIDDPKTTLSIFASAVREVLGDKDLAYADPAERAIVARLA